MTGRESKKADKLAAQPPRIPAQLDQAPDTLADESTWEQVHVAGSLEAPAQLEDVTFRRVRLTDLSLTGRVITRLRCENVEFLRCDLSGLTCDSAVMERVAFVDCRMTGLTLSGSKLADVRIEGCGAELMNFRMAKARRLNVESSVLRSADFQEASLAQCRFLDSDLRAASFQRAELSEVELFGSKLDELTGVSAMRGARVTTRQAVTLGALLLAEAGISVVD